MVLYSSREVVEPYFKDDLANLIFLYETIDFKPREVYNFCFKDFFSDLSSFNLHFEISKTFFFVSIFLSEFWSKKMENYFTKYPLEEDSFSISLLLDGAVFGSSDFLGEL